MWHEFRADVDFFDELKAIDEEIAASVRKGRCQSCQGPLHRSDYVRKPRGGLFAAGQCDAEMQRISLCCGWEGCRRRATPPSVRFFGRRVYVELTVLLASVAALSRASWREAEAATGVPRRTLGRWERWWRGRFVETPSFVEALARSVGGISVEALPRSLLELFEGETFSDRLLAALRWLVPLTTQTCRFDRSPSARPG